MKTVLSRIVLPGPDRAERSGLCYHADGPVVSERDGLLLAAGSRVAFDSYFNGFFYGKYLDYTHIRAVSVRVEISGQARVGMCVCTPAGERSLFEDRFSGGSAELPEVDLTTLPAGGMLYLTVQALESPVRFRRGWYETLLPPVNDVMAAAVICTYHREEYVARSLAQLRGTVWNDENCPIRELLDLFIIDNGRTLVLADEPHVRLVPNKNYGGSGGFTRGLMEAYRRRDIYSHVLFMDDDISFETETLVKTIQLLRYARASDRPLCVGGQMLLEDAPATQYEAGLVFRNGRAELLDCNMDLSRREGLLSNGTGQAAQCNGWYYYCQPLSVVDEAGLPMPFFIKVDDTEYCLRTKPRILLMNGIGVWHRRFDEKYSVHLEYYVKRNELVTGALHGRGEMRSGLWKLIRAAGKSALLGDPRRIEFLLRAYQDFLRGPDFFLKTDEEALNAELLAEMKKPAKSRPVSILTDPFRLLPVTAAFVRGYGAARTQYRERAGELTSIDFWRRHLEI